MPAAIKLEWRLVQEESEAVWQDATGVEFREKWDISEKRLRADLKNAESLPSTGCTVMLKDRITTISQQVQFRKKVAAIQHKVNKSTLKRRAGIPILVSCQPVVETTDSAAPTQPVQHLKRFPLEEDPLVEGVAKDFQYLTRLACARFTNSCWAETG